MNHVTYRSPKAEVRERGIHGRGLFAKTAIAQGEIVAGKGGYIVSKQRWTELEREVS